VDLSRLKDVLVDHVHMIVHIGSGALLMDVDRACQPFGVACVLGFNPEANVLEQCVSNCAGLLSREHGLAADNLVEIELVEPNGVVRVHGHESLEEVLRGLRKGDRALGIVTRISLRAFPVEYALGGQVVNVAFSASDAAGVLRQWRGFVDNTARSTCCVAVLPCGAPVVPMVLCETRMPGGPHALASEAVGDTHADNLLSAGKCAFGVPAVSTIKRMDYHSELQPRLRGLQEACAAGSWSISLPFLSDGAIECLVKYTRHDYPNRLSSIVMLPVAMDVPKNTSSCVSNPTGDIDLEQDMHGVGREAFLISVQAKHTDDNAGCNRARVEQWSAALWAELSTFAATTQHTLHDRTLSACETHYFEPYFATPK